MEAVVMENCESQVWYERGFVKLLVQNKTATVSHYFNQ